MNSFSCLGGSSFKIYFTMVIWFSSFSVAFEGIVRTVTSPEIFCKRCLSCYAFRGVTSFGAWIHRNNKPLRLYNRCRMYKSVIIFKDSWIRIDLPFPLITIRYPTYFLLFYKLISYLLRRACWIIVRVLIWGSGGCYGNGVEQSWRVEW